MGVNTSIARRHLETFASQIIGDVNAPKKLTIMMDIAIFHTYMAKLKPTSAMPQYISITIKSSVITG
jgi:hypothetical protein